MVLYHSEAYGTRPLLGLYPPGLTTKQQRLNVLIEYGEKTIKQLPPLLTYPGPAAKKQLAAAQMHYALEHNQTDNDDCWPAYGHCQGDYAPVQMNNAPVQFCNSQVQTNNAPMQMNNDLMQPNNTPVQMNNGPVWTNIAPMQVYNGPVQTDDALHLANNELPVQ